MKLHYILVYTFLSLLLLFSCNKKPSEETQPIVSVTPPPEFLTLKEVRTVDQDVIHKYEYNDDNLIIDGRFYYNGDLFHKYEYSYSVDTISITHTYYDFGLPPYFEKVYLLNDTTLKIERYSSPSSPDVPYDLLYFSNSECGVYLLEHYISSDELSFYVEFEFIDENCSYLAFKYDADGQIIEHVEYILDGKKNKNESIGYYKYFGIKQNGNDISRKKWDENGVLLEDLSDTLEYDYNDSNYPFKAYLYQPLTSVIIFLYYY